MLLNVMRERERITQLQRERITQSPYEIKHTVFFLCLFLFLHLVKPYLLKIIHLPVLTHC